MHDLFPRMTLEFEVDLTAPGVTCGPSVVDWNWRGYPPGSVYCVRIVRQTPRWVFPVHRFVEYEPSDEAWARPIGFGHEVMDTTIIEAPHAIAVKAEGSNVTFRAMGYSGEPTDAP